jgi:transcriptional regulator with XRE-family HTH domain
MNRFGTKLAGAVDALGSQLALANASNVDASALSRILRGVWPASAKTARALIEAAPESLRPDLVRAWALDALGDMPGVHIDTCKGAPKLKADDLLSQLPAHLQDAALNLLRQSAEGNDSARGYLEVWGRLQK